MAEERQQEQPDSSSPRRGCSRARARLLKVCRGCVEAPPELHRSFRRHRHALRRSARHGHRKGARLLKLRRGCIEVPAELHRSSRRRRPGCNGACQGAAMDHASCNGAPPRLQWSAAGDAMELRRGCSGARPGMQWSSAAAAVERGRGCNGASSERRAPVAAMELRVGCNGASSERRAPVAAMKLRRGCNGARRGRQWSFVGTPAVLRRSFFFVPRCCNGSAVELPRWSSALR